MISDKRLGKEKDNIPLHRGVRPDQLRGDPGYQNNAARFIFPVVLQIPAQRKVFFLLAFGFLLRFGLAWLPEKFLYYLISDDAYYYFTIAGNFITRGMLSADGITLTNGFHPLWLFVITPVYFFFRSSPWLGIHLVMTIAAVFDTAAAFLIYKTLKRLGKPNVGFWAALFYLANPYGLLHTMNGLETAQNNFFLAFLVFLSVRSTPDWLQKNWLFLGTICGLTLLSRTDNVFALGILFGYLWWRDRTLPAIVKTAVVVTLLVLPWLVFNVISFGSVVQTSGTAYPWLYHQQYLNEHQTYFSSALIPHLIKLGFYSFAQNAFHYGNWILTAIVAGFLIFRLSNWQQKCRPLVWTLAAACVFMGVHTFIRWSVRPWYPQAVFVLTLPLVALALERMNRFWLGLCIVAVLFFSGWAVWSTPLWLANRSKVMLEIVNGQIPAEDRVGIFNSGYLQYFTDRKVINLDGLVNNEVLPYYRKHKGIEYLRKRNIAWLVDRSIYLGAVFGPYLGPAAESTLSLVKVWQDSLHPEIAVGIVQVLPDSLRPLPERRMRRLKEPTHYQWGPLPFLKP